MTAKDQLQNLQSPVQNENVGHLFKNDYWFQQSHSRAFCVQGLYVCTGCVLTKPVLVGSGAEAKARKATDVKSSQEMAQLLFPASP